MQWKFSCFVCSAFVSNSTLDVNRALTFVFWEGYDVVQLFEEGALFRRSPDPVLEELCKRNRRGNRRQDIYIMGLGRERVLVHFLGISLCCA